MLQYSGAGRGLAGGINPGPFLETYPEGTISNMDRHSGPKTITTAHLEKQKPRNAIRPNIREMRS